MLSPSPNDEGVWIHRDAWLHLADLDAGVGLEYALKQAGNGVYAFVLEGDVTIEGQQLHRRDGLGLWEVDHLGITADTSARLLLMEVPLLG